MKKAALYVKGKIIMGFNHGDAFGQLSQQEKNEKIISGFFDDETEEFQSEIDTQHFFNKNILLVRHALVDDTNDPDTDISYEGEKQIEFLASFLYSHNYVNYTFISSPFLRCLRTSAILEKSLGLKVLVEPKLSEIPVFLENDEQFLLPNRSDQFPQFKWTTEKDFILEPESQKSFLERTLFVLKHLPHNCVLITHFGVICNIAKLALCEQKAYEVLKDGVSPASITHIHQQKIEKVEQHENKHHSGP